MKNEIEEIKDLFEQAKENLKQAEELLAELEGMQEFKDGDVLYNPKCSVLFVLKKQWKSEKSYFYFSYETDTCRLITDHSGAKYWGLIENTIIATEQQKQILFDALKKDGKRWNAETKQIEKLRWRADKGDDYWYMCSEVYPLIDDECNDPIDEKRFNGGNYFQTEAECQAFCDKVKTLANGND